MQDFFANCATVLQKYGFSYLRGAGTTLLLALVGTFFRLPDWLCGGRFADHPR